MSGPILSEFNRRRRIQDASKGKLSDSVGADCGDVAKVPLCELPFDPTVGAEQLAHAKQRIREQRAEIAVLEANLAVLQDAMARRQDIIDYVRQIILHDSVNLGVFPDETTAAEYQKLFLSVLDGDKLHGMSAALERQLLSEQLVSLQERIRMLDARDTTKTKSLKEKDQRVTALLLERDDLLLQLSKAKSHHSNLYHALQDSKQELFTTQESVSQVKREADMLRKTLDATLADLKNKEAAYAYSQQKINNLEAQIQSMTQQSDADKQASAEAQRIVGALAAEFAKLTDQAQMCPLESPLWVSNLTQTAEATERLKAALLQANLGGAVSDTLKRVTACLSLRVSNERALYHALQQSRDSHERVVTELGMAFQVKQSALFPMTEAVGSYSRSASDGVACLKQCIDVLSALRFASAEVPLPAAESFVSELIGTTSSLCTAILSDGRMNGDELTKMDQALRQRPASVPDPPSPFDEERVVAFKGVLQTLRGVQDAHLSKLINAGKQQLQVVTDYVELVLPELTALRSPNYACPAVPSQVVSSMVELLSGNIGLLSTLRHEAQKLADAQQLLQDVNAQLKTENARLAAGVQITTTPPVTDHPLSDWIAGLTLAASELEEAQRTALDAMHSQQYSDQRSRVARLMSDLLHSCEGVRTPNDEYAKHVVAVVLQFLQAIARESEESLSLWRLLLCFDDEGVLSTLERGVDERTLEPLLRRSVVRAAAVNAQRAHQGCKSLQSLLRPKETTRVVEVPVLQAPPPVSSVGVACQTSPQPLPKEVTLDDAMAMLKAAGKWPKPNTKSSSSEQFVQATHKNSMRATQTPRSDPQLQSADKSVETDAFLLEQYLGVRRGAEVSGGGGIGRQRSASIIQIFGDSGAVEQIGSGVVDSRAHALLHRSASSIPSRHGLADLACTPSRSFSRKHSIGALLERRNSLVRLPPSGDDSENDTESIVEEGSNELLFGHRVPSGSGATLARQVLELAVDNPNVPTAAPADFYALLQHPRPMSAAAPVHSEPQATAAAPDPVKRPLSASYRNLRERSRQLEHIHERISRVDSKSTLKDRNAKIKDVIAAGAEAARRPSSAGGERISIRQLSAAAPANAAPKSPALQGNIEGWACE